MIHWFQISPCIKMLDKGLLHRNINFIFSLIAILITLIKIFIFKTLLSIIHILKFIIIKWVPTDFRVRTHTQHL